ncbi:MAG: trimeric intracellular cation channel family protein [Deltaproteobacteria bacterium]|nr:trimeric intracellular cation channel family protein [Deltaproteobacteria bacterium]
MELAQIIYILDLFGVTVFAVSGSLAAGRKRMDIFGVTVLALVTSLGGGTLRDLLLNSRPVFWINDQDYVLVATAMALITFIAVRRYTVPRVVLLLSDAFGLAIFTVVGTMKALDTTGSGIIAVVMGVMTGVAGGMIRDVLSKEVPLILRKEIYATAALTGSLVCVLLYRLSIPESALVVVSVLVTLSIRLAAIHWQASLPVLSFRDEVIKSDPSAKDRS